jgi:hypothetical protein
MPESIELVAVAELPAELPAEHPTRNRLLAGIFGLMVLYTCAIASVLIVPLLLALLLSLMLAPAVRLLGRWHLPRPLAALLVLLVGTGAERIVAGGSDRTGAGRGCWRCRNRSRAWSWR